jgi:hypothetical protein
MSQSTSQKSLQSQGRGLSKVAAEEVVVEVKSRAMRCRSLRRSRSSHGKVKDEVYVYVVEVLVGALPWSLSSQRSRSMVKVNAWSGTEQRSQRKAKGNAWAKGTVEEVEVLDKARTGSRT